MKRRFVKLAAFLLLGAIINVAVAWTIAYRKLPDKRSTTGWGILSNTEPSWLYHIHKSCGYMRIWRRAENPRSPTNYRLSRVPKCPAPDWSQVATMRPDVPAEDNDPWIEFAAGWPRLAMKSEYCEEIPRYYYDHVSDGISLSGTRGDGKPLRILPFAVIWPGFAINTIFYAAILWLLFAASGFVRRRIRARRGQCPACAYPVGASDVCTECGKLVSKPSQRD